MDKKLLDWAKELQSLSQAGLEYSENHFDIERYERIREISVEIISSYSGLDHKKVTDLFANEKGYQTPKIDIRGAVFNDKGEILMVREKIDNKWSLPGGWADVGLSIRENVVKEAKEEAGAVVDPLRLIAVFDRNKHVHDLFPYSVYKIFVECDLRECSFEENIETSEHRFFPADKLPELSEGRNSVEQIKMCFEARRSPLVETLFD